VSRAVTILLIRSRTPLVPFYHDQRPAVAKARQVGSTHLFKTEADDETRSVVFQLSASAA
jgi:hypothetical protein